MLTLSYLALEYFFNGYLLAVVTCIAVIAFVIIFIKTDTSTCKSLISLLFFYVFSIVFWVFDEQLYTSVEIFIHRNVDTYLWGIDIPASTFTLMNSLSILFGGLILA